MSRKYKTGTSKWKVILIIAVSLLAGLITYLFPNFAAQAEKPILDHHLRSTSPTYTHKRIVIIMIGDKSVVQLGNWPWPTNIYADIINGPLSGAETIAFNVDFMSMGNAEGDGVFAEAMRQHGNVVLGARYLPTEDKLVYPRRELRESAAEVALYQALLESDGIYRQFRMYITDKEGTLHPTYMHKILTRSGYNVDIDRETHLMRITSTDHDHFSEMQLDESHAAWTVNVDAEDMEIYEYADVAEGRIPSGTFDDAIVYIAVSNASERRLISTPDGDVYSPVWTANQLYTVLTGFSPDQVSHGESALLTALACLLCGFAALLLPVAASAIAPLVLTASLATASHQLFVRGILYLPIANILIWGWSAFLIVAIIQIRSVSSIVDYTIIPLQQTFSPGKKDGIGGKARLVRHLQGLEGIFKSAGLRLLEPLIDDSHEFIRKCVGRLPDPDENGGSAVIRNVSRQSPRHRLLVLHPKTDPSEVNEYTLLGVDSLKSVYVIQSMVSLIRNASLYYKAMQYGEEKQEMSFNMIKCMVAAMDAKDPITAGHSQRVSRVALQIAKKLNFTDRELEELELSAIVHDIGKIGIQDRVLHKRGIFSSNEFSEMKQHPEKGISIMNSSGLSENTVDAILNHHERLDGQGYPGGKDQDAIGLYAKIIKISDVYDALLGQRQYKKAWPLEKVCDLLYLGRGREFDAGITDLFLDMVKPEGWIPPESGGSEKRPSEEVYKKYMQYGIGQIQSVSSYLSDIHVVSAYYSDTPDFGNTNIFMGMEWGDAFFQSHFLAKKPHLLEYDGISEACHFALLLNDGMHGVAVYSFLRDYLTSGMIFLSEGGWEPESELGDPAYIQGGNLLWDLGKLFALQIRDVGGYDSAVAFITKYVFDDSADQALA